jgi:ribosomal protein S18 acetylase RimI-like enzyme
MDLHLSADPTEDEIQVLRDGLDRFNQASPFGRDRVKRPLAVWLRERGRILGGVYGDTHHSWLYLSYLWVDEALRSQGWGRRLVESFEVEGVARGCRAAWVDTYDFQAPRFYERLGYVEFGRLEDFPPGSARVFYWKELQTPGLHPLGYSDYGGPAR